MKSLEEKWDKKALNYNRYTDNPNSLEAAICLYIQDSGIDISNKHVLDIGCGTGVYTLKIAQKAKTVDALDISPAMLKILNDDAGRIGLSNIKTYQGSWETYSLDNIYDIAIATMFPALKKDEQFQKMHNAAKIKLFLGWGGKKGTELIEKLFRLHGSTYQPPNSAILLIQWLNKQDIPYKIIEHMEEKIRSKPFNDAVENYSWHLKIRGMDPDKTKIASVLKEYTDSDGNVVERTMNYLNLVIW